MLRDFTLLGINCHFMIYIYKNEILQLAPYMCCHVKTGEQTTDRGSLSALIGYFVAIALQSYKLERTVIVKLNTQLI